MANSSIQLIDLPDELLLFIFKKLNNVELLYSLMGINKQIDRVLYDSIFTRRLTLTSSSSNRHIYPLRDELLDRFCLEILPKIHRKIEWLTVESLSMERIFRVDDYSNLRQLGLVSIQWEGLERLFDEKNSLVKKFKNQISTLFFSISNRNVFTYDFITKSVLTNIFKIFPNLVYLRFVQLSNRDVGYISFRDEISMFSSSLLRELHINVSSLTECLYLLDGRLNQLKIFYVNIEIIYRIAPNFDMKKKLDNLRYFSLISKNETFCYSQSILPLLHRMSNLKRLDLYLIIDENKFIDGNCLNNDTINRLPRLNHFIFNIQSRIYEYNQNDIRSNEDIQITFKTFPNHKVISCVDYFPEQNFARCHYYSCPYTTENYDNISNNFPGGLFKCVHQISLFDERPFQHEFFIKISQAFPFLQKLTLENFQSQNKTSNEDDQHLPIVEYSYLTELRLLDVHDDYIEQFLFHSKSVLPNNISLSIRYDSLQRVTNHFIREQTRINSAKIKHVLLTGPGQYHLSKDFHQYFPNLQPYRFSINT